MSRERITAAGLAQCIEHSPLFPIVNSSNHINNSVNSGSTYANLMSGQWIWLDLGFRETEFMVEPQTQDKNLHTSYCQVKRDRCSVFNILHRHSVMEWYFEVLAGFQMAKERQTRRRGRKPKDRVSETISAFKTATEYTNSYFTSTEVSYRSNPTLP